MPTVQELLQQYRANPTAFIGGGQPMAAQLSAAQGAEDLSQLGTARQIATEAAGAADPFAAQRGQYQTALQQLMAGGSSAMAQDPSYKFRVGQGQQALERSMAAQGYLGSGNLLQELQKYGQEAGSQEYGAQFGRLAKLAGVEAGSPGTAGGILAGQYDWRQQAAGNVGAALAPPVVGGTTAVSAGAVAPGAVTPGAVTPGAIAPTTPIAPIPVDPWGGGRRYIWDPSQRMRVLMTHKEAMASGGYL